MRVLAAANCELNLPGLGVKRVSTKFLQGSLDAAKALIDRLPEGERLNPPREIGAGVFLRAERRSQNCGTRRDVEC